MSPEIYRFLEHTSPLLILWSFAFTLIHSVRIVHRFRRSMSKVPDNAVLTELAGLPLTVLQSVAFVLAVLHADWLSMLLFLWWGPGFLAVLVLVIVARMRRRRIDWHPFRYLISYLCKLYYLAYMVTFFLHHLPGMMFAFSVWIINDQYEKAFMSLDADRTRRTFHDRWLFRLLYPAGLLVPLCFAATPLRPFSIGYGLALLGLWIAGLVYVSRQGAFFRLPEDPSLLRNMVYFPKLRVAAAMSEGGEKELFPRKDVLTAEIGSRDWKTFMANDNGSLGKASLWTSIAGVIVPVCLAILLVIWIQMFVPMGRLGPSYENQVRIIAGFALCVFLFVMLELVALGCGIAARRTAIGKIGLKIAIVLLTLAVALIAFVLYRSDFFKY